MRGKNSFAMFVHRSTLLLGVLALLGCMVLQFTPASAASAADMAYVRVVHAAPGAGTVDVFVDGATLLPGFTFGTVTGYVAVAAGSHKIQVAPAGKGIGASVITQTVTVSAGVPYTVAALGTAASGFSLAAFADNNLVSGNMAQVRVYHLSPDAGPVNVATGGSTVITGLTYTHASGYLSVPGGAYTFNVTATQAGATVPVSTTLTGGMVYSVFAVGLLKGTPALAFKLGAVAGVPGMPGTGSDPRPVTHVGSSNPLLPWFFGALALLLLSSSVAARRFAFARQK